MSSTSGCKVRLLKGQQTQSSGDQSILHAARNAHCSITIQLLVAGAEHLQHLALSQAGMLPSWILWDLGLTSSVAGGMDDTKMAGAGSFLKNGGQELKLSTYILVILNHVHIAN